MHATGQVDRAVTYESQLLTISVNATVAEAVELMHDRTVSRLIVLDGPTIVGLVSLEDITERPAAARLGELDLARRPRLAWIN